MTYLEYYTAQMAAPLVEKLMVPAILKLSGGGMSGEEFEAHLKNATEAIAKVSSRVAAALCDALDVEYVETFTITIEPPADKPGGIVMPS